MYFALLVTFFVVVLTVYIWQNGHSPFWKNLMAIPGPKPKVVVGNLFDLLGDTEQTFRAMRKRAIDYYPIYKVHALGRSFVGIFSPEDIELVLSNMKHITKNKVYNFLHSWLGTGLLTSTGQKWQTRRKLLTPSFHFTILQEFLHIFNDEAKNLVEVLKKEANKPYIDVVKPITEFTLVSIGETSMGTNLNTSNNTEKSKYKQAVYEFGEITTYKTPRPWLFNPVIYSFTQKSKEEKVVTDILHSFTTSVIEDRKKKLFANNEKQASYATKKRLAMLDLLLTFQADGANITDEGIREEVDTFMFEGHDTTSVALCYTLMLLANHPDIQEEILEEIQAIVPNGETPTFKNYQEMNFLERCIKESLRLYPSVPFIGRVAGEDIHTHSGYTIPKGCDINIYIYDLHHNPNVYEDPEKFDPDRFLPENCKNRHPFAYLPFSAGARNCIGQKFALLEMKTVICTIIRNFKLEAVDKPEDMRFVTDLVLRPKGEIRVKFVPRIKC
uniref:uncharacterized LOC140038990 n=1 Tax=Aethina tumida TaxID=116153 RepID=UPI003AF5A8BD